MFNLITPIGHQLGYGIVGLNLANTLVQEGVEFNLSPLSMEQVPAKYQESLSKPLSVPYNEKWPTIKIWHQNDSSMPQTSKRIFFPIFELTGFTDIEIQALDNTDKILVCSDWGKQVIKENVSKKVSVVPLGVDKEIFKYVDQPKPTRPLRFINIGKWEKRKGHDILPDILLGLEDQNFELWMVPNNPFISLLDDRNWKHMYRNKLGDRVKFFPRMDSQQDIANIISQCDIGVFPSRAEGWNLDLVEVMATTGVPAYFTNYSAHTHISMMIEEFIPYDNYSTHYSVESANDGIWFHGQGYWAQVVVRKEINRLQRVINEFQLYNGGMKKEFSKLIHNKFSWKNSVNALLKGL